PRRPTSSVGWPGKSVITCTCVSVGSGKASTVRLRKAKRPAPTTSAASRKGALGRSSERRSRSSSTLARERELVVEQDRALLDDRLAARETAQHGNPALVGRARLYLAAREVAGRVLDEDVLAVARPARGGRRGAA